MAAISIRQSKARLRRRLMPSYVQVSLRLLTLLGLLAGIAAALFSMPLLYLVLVIAAPALMLRQWYKGELFELIPTTNLQNDTDIFNLLEPDLLAKLSSQDLSAKSLVEALSDSPGGRFYAVRFQVPIGSLINYASDVASSATPIFQATLQIASTGSASQLDSAAITAAAILATPDIDQLLASVGLDRKDIQEGYLWYANEQKTRQRMLQKSHYGGIGRDLSFGYTPILSQMGHNITAEIEQSGLLFRQPEVRRDTIQHTAHLLSSAGRQNIALVGETGSGRTTVVYALAEQLLANRQLLSNIRFHQIVGLDASSLLARSGGRGELEHMLIQIFNEAIRAKNIILFLDDAHLFLADGTGSVNLSNILQPILQGGRLRLVLTMNESWWQQINQTNPALTQLLNRSNIEPLNRADTMDVMEDQTVTFEYRHNVTYTYRALIEAYNLSERFISDQALPGKAIDLLEAAAVLAEGGQVTEQTIQQAIEQRYGVKVRSVNQTGERDTLLNLEASIHERMINQTRAVNRVADALRRARAGVRNVQRPVGTFLFLGPTGVGKTELSKCLAEVYYGGDENLIRIDLNEYSSANDVSRLLESAVTNSQSLCAMVAKQPFSIILLDEIEKAHPNVLNALLQLLDEGILRDVNNREINFRETIIIATSNAGADNIRAHIDNGEQIEQFEEAFINELIESQQFKPEFLNRFDEIILFRPLTKDELLLVVDLIIKGMNKTLANQKLTIELSLDAKRWLVDQGYDPRLGARPLRRVVQRTVESIVAKRVLSGESQPGSVLAFTAADLAAS
ncbi:ATP-dependent Clp protease ATP-binding subunit [Candidatus Saccharibacteria bacterium]|nr:ATP-dependent Clp protease ATP-binding subunit [Candidatus Saccharibacteria bacterium]